MQGLIGRKVGMTQVFGSDGRRVAVTVIEAGPCVVVQRKTRKKDGYDAVQLGFGVQKERFEGLPHIVGFFIRSYLQTGPGTNIKRYHADVINIITISALCFSGLDVFTPGPVIDYQDSKSTSVAEVLYNYVPP